MNKLIDKYGVASSIEALRPLLTDERADRIEQVIDARLSGFTVVLDNLHDPHNGAAAVRSIEAFGLTDLHVVEPNEPFRVTSKITIGCEKWVEIHKYKAFSTCAAQLRAKGFKLYATLPDADQELADIDMSTPCAIVFGNEHAGLSDDVVGQCDGAVSIAMYGFSQSFNLSVSVALTTQRLAAKRRDALGQRGDLRGQERALLRARWYAHSVKGVEQILERYVSKATHVDVAEQTHNS